MYAIVKAGGKQYKVETGDFLKVEKLDGEPGSQVDLDQVLALSTDEGITLGTPMLEDAKVTATILRTARHRKIVVFKKKRRKGYHKKQGHRQWYTLLRIEDILSRSSASSVPPAPAEQPSGDTPESTEQE